MDKSLVTGLEDCWAREGQRLREHLIEVATSAGSVKGSLSEQLSFLAGLLHDAGKARPAWQDYFERSLRKERGLEKLPHAYIGAALFALYGQALLNAYEPSLEAEQHYLLLVQDLQDHHGRLRDRARLPVEVKIPWRESMKSYPPSDLFIAELDQLVHRFFPALPLSIKTYEAFTQHLGQIEQTWKRLANRQNMKLQRATKGSSPAYAAWICRDTTGKLIAADRLSASKLTRDATTLTPETARKALETFKTKLDEKHQNAIKEGHSVMADKRQSVHEQTLSNYLDNQGSTWFTLNLPVGWGKTLTSLRIALEQAAVGQAERIIYVAPYLAILSQAAKEIREMTGLEVLEHHHLALLSDAPDEREPTDVLTMESWRAPVIATTFNQLFRAIFPASAQQSIRIPALEHAFIIVDEPQIINASVYNAFLKGLEVLCQRMNASVILVTATLPPTVYGLSAPPKSLTPPVESANRYTLIIHNEPWDEEQLAAKVLDRFKRYKQVAVILNTIADAVKIYQLVNGNCEGGACLNLHGLMTPLHKAHQIAKISKRLKTGQPVLVVSTQVLEAGVNLSFRCILRAKPILSSIAQAAGRGNRHAEGNIAHIEVFNFLRESGTDTRQLIYRNEHQRNITDKLLSSSAEWSEAQTSELIKEYFGELSRVDAEIEVFKRFKKAAEGEWSHLAKLTPFEAAEDDDGNELFLERNASVFVATADEWNSGQVQQWMKYFNIENVPSIYEHYRDKRFLAQLEFGDRKRFLSLVRQFVAPLRWRLVPQVCGQVDPTETAILRARDDSTYHLDTGFGYLLFRKDFSDFERNLEARMSRSYDESFI